MISSTATEEAPVDSAEGSLKPIPQQLLAAKAKRGQDISTIKCPAIINVSLSDTAIERRLVLQYKLKVSSTTLKDTVIFPMSKVTFLVANPVAWNACGTTSEDEDHCLEQLVDKMGSMFKRCYLVLVCNESLQSNISYFNRVQDKYLFSAVTVMMVSSMDHAVTAMSNIAKLCYEPFANIVLEKLCKLMDPEPDGKMMECLESILRSDGRTPLKTVQSSSDDAGVQRDSETSQRPPLAQLLQDYFSKANES